MHLHAHIYVSHTHTHSHLSNVEEKTLFIRTRGPAGKQVERDNQEGGWSLRCPSAPKAEWWWPGRWTGAKLRLGAPVKWLLAWETRGWRLSLTKWIRAKHCTMGSSRAERPGRVNQWEEQENLQGLGIMPAREGRSPQEAKQNKGNESLPNDALRRTEENWKGHWSLQRQSWVSFSGALGHGRGSKSLTQVWVVL